MESVIGTKEAKSWRGSRGNTGVSSLRQYKEGGGDV
jgi:hypothetical protein